MTESIYDCGAAAAFALEETGATLGTVAQILRARDASRGWPTDAAGDGERQHVIVDFAAECAEVARRTGLPTPFVAAVLAADQRYAESIGLIEWTVTVERTPPGRRS